MDGLLDLSRRRGLGSLAGPLDAAKSAMGGFYAGSLRIASWRTLLPCLTRGLESRVLSSLLPRLAKFAKVEMDSLR